MIRETLPEPNPLVEIDELDIKPKMKQIHRKNEYEEYGAKESMWEYFAQNNRSLVYQRFDNYPWSMIPLNNHRFAAGCFFDCRKLIGLNREIKLKEFPNVLLNHLFPNTMKMKENRLHLEQEKKGYNGLRFDSQFESGNLHTANRVGTFEYDLMMQNDTNSKGHTQWFYFAVENTVRNQTITFNIINFVKDDSQFNEGQRPVIYSRKKNTWNRGGHNVSYFRNNFRRENSQTKTYYTLTFQYKFESSQDKVYFAQCYPYTHTALLILLDKLMRKYYKVVQIRELCKTITKLSCPLITIGNNNAKLAIILMGRQHPGETPASFACEGAIDFLVGNTQEAEMLRNYFQFYIIPMINPDGVVFGNYRCNLHGVDLNRIWITPHKELHDAVWYIRDLIKQVQQTQEIILILDFHGHSKKMNSFFYGNNACDQQKLLPLVASTISKMINLRDCAFFVHGSKKSTARVALQEELKNGFTYTFEISFYAYRNVIPIDFTETSYKQLGTDILLALYKIYESKFNKSNSFPKSISPQINDQVNRLLQNLDLANLDICNSDSGSDSDPEEDILLDKEQQSFNEQKRVLKHIVLHKRKITQPVPKYETKSTQTEINHFQNLMLDQKVLQNIEEQIKQFRKPFITELFNSDQPVANENSVGSQTDISLQQILGRMHVYHVRVSNKSENPFIRNQILQTQLTNNSKPLVIVLKNPYSQKQISEDRRQTSNSIQRKRETNNRLKQRHFSIQGTPERKYNINPISPGSIFQDATFEKIANISRLKFNDRMVLKNESLF